MSETIQTVRTKTPTGIVFTSEPEVESHFNQLVRVAKTELKGKVNSVVATQQQKSLSNSKLIAVGVGAVGVTVVGLAITQIITGIIALSLLGGSVAVLTLLKYRYPVWMAKLRASQVVDLAQAEYQKELDLIEAKNTYLNKLREQAANDPIATRSRIANEMADEIDQGDDATARFEGLLKTQAQNIAQAKKDFPGQSFEIEESDQASMEEALGIMNQDIELARTRLDEYVQRTRLIETRLKLASGARSMAEFMHDDSAADRIRKMVSEVATEAAELEVQEARAALRKSVAAANRRIKQQS